MKPTSIVLALLAIAFLLVGAADVAYGSGQHAPKVHWAHLVVSVFLIFLWYRFDSDAREYRRRPLLNVGVVALSIVAIPTYLFLSRGAKGGAISVGWLLLYGLSLMVLTAAGAALAIALGAA